MSALGTGNRDRDEDRGGDGERAHSLFPVWKVEGMAPGGSWPGLGADLRSQVAQGQRQCQELQDKLAASEATVRAQAEQLEKYHVLLRELKPRVGQGVCAEAGMPCAPCCTWGRGGESCLEGGNRELTALPSR